MSETMKVRIKDDIEGQWYGFGEEYTVEPYLRETFSVVGGNRGGSLIWKAHCEILQENNVQNSNQSDHNSVTKPLHYHKDGLDPITVMKRTFTEEELRGFFRGNILKYSMRYREKGGMADLEKLSDYTRMLMELEDETT